MRAAVRLSLSLLVPSLLGACGPEKGTVGAVFAQKDDGRLVVHEAPEGLAAHKAGLKEGDEILLVDGMDVRSLDDKALHRVLSGEVDQSVRLTVLRGEEVLRVTLKRTPAKKRAPSPKR